MPSSASYRHRFGSLLRAYTLIGYTPARDLSFIETNRLLRQRQASHIDEIVRTLSEDGAQVERHPKTDLLTVNQEFTASLVLARCQQSRAGHHRWLVRVDNSLSPDLTVAARLYPGNQDILDYYLLPGLDALSARLRLAPENGFTLDVYRFDNLNFFLRMGRRAALGEAA
jgi:hypothetical protein